MRGFRRLTLSRASAVFAQLGLLDTPYDHRRVLAVLQYIRA